MILSMVQSERNFLRKQVLFSGFIALMITVLCFFPNFPFDKNIFLLTLFLSLMYFAFYLFYDAVSKYRDIIIVLMSDIALVFIGIIVHLSGGIVSPFVFIYFCIVLSESAYESAKTLSIGIAVISYSVVIAGEYFGFLKVSNLFAEKIYSSGLITGVIVVAVVSSLVVTGYVTKLLTFKLKLDLRKEHEEKESLFKRFLELTAYSQIGMLTHKLTHDLRGLFFVLSSYFEMQVDNNEKDREDKKIMVENLDRMHYMINQVTKYGKPSVEWKEKINPAEFMENMINIVSFFEPAKEIKFTCRFPSNSDFYIWASKYELQNAYFNIFKNAIESIEKNSEKKEIKVVVQKNEKYVKIKVLDTGKGISEEVLSYLFEKPFTTKSGGTGVGMLIIKSIIDHHGGTIEIKNRKKIGAIVTVELPLVEE